MRLIRKSQACLGCTKPCIDACPLKLNFSSLSCIHCPPHEASCAKACKNQAFYEIAEGTLQIEQSKCNGCGKCLEACPLNAITIKNNKAVKCDLCTQQSFAMYCMNACPKHALKLKDESQNTHYLQTRLGWQVCRSTQRIAKVLKTTEHYRIVELSSGSKVLILSFPPIMSTSELALFSKMLQTAWKRGVKRASLPTFLEEFCEINNIELDEEQQEYMLKMLYAFTSKQDALACLLDSDDIEEIAIIGVHRPVFVYHQSYGWLESNLKFTSQEKIRTIVNALIKDTERRLTVSQPRINAVLPTGSRMIATLPPVSFRHPTVTIRKFNIKPTIPMLINWKTFSSEFAAFIWLAMLADCSIIVAGNTGSGKTTTLNAICSFIPAEERILIVEETPEMWLPHRHTICLNADEELGISMNNLIKDTLRMRPDRVIVGEVRNEDEAKAFVDTLLAGQGKGSYCTFHAGSATQCINRFTFLGVHEHDVQALDLVIVQRRFTRIDKSAKCTTELRRIVEVAELTQRYKKPLRTLFRYDEKRDRLKKISKSKRVANKIKLCFSMEGRELRKELNRRKRYLKTLQHTSLSFKEFFEKVNGARYEL
jgi:Flp pilus assembly CpaF family ATPase/ferredoxin